jgi:beta-lactamase regulating signal transducer with metallopeptidase domain
MNAFELSEMSDLLMIATKGVVLLAVTGLAALLLRRASAAARHAVWFLGMAGLLLLPLAALVAPSWVVEVPGAAVGFLTDAAWERVPYLGPVLPGRAAGAEGTSSANTTIRQALASAFGLWLGGTAVLLVICMTGLVALARLTRRSPPFLDGRVRTLTRELALAQGIRGHVLVLRGRAGAIPMSLGLVRRAILLPAGAERWDDFLLQAVLRHELAHVRRRDCLTQAVAEVSLALNWLNPLAWLAVRRLRVEREHACDDAVVLGGVRPSDYALALIDLAARARPLPRRFLLAATMIRPVQLNDRLRAILDDGRARRSSRLGAAAAAFLAVVVLGAVAGFTPAAGTTADMQPASPSEESTSTQDDVSVDASKDARAIDVERVQISGHIEDAVTGAPLRDVQAGRDGLLETEFARSPSSAPVVIPEILVNRSAGAASRDSTPDRIAMMLLDEVPVIKPRIFRDVVRLQGELPQINIDPDPIEPIEAIKAPAAALHHGPEGEQGAPVTIHVKNQNFHDATLWLVSRRGRVHLGAVTGKAGASFTTPVTIPADVWRVEIDLIGGEWCQTEPLSVDAGDVLDLLVAVDVSNMPGCYPAGLRPED